jgi:hypothetical protein
MVLIVLLKVSSGRVYYSYLALIHLGIMFNFSFQAVANQIDLKAVWKRPPPFARVNGKPLHATGIVRYVVRMQESARIKRNHATNFNVANVAHFDIILSISGLQK